MKVMKWSAIAFAVTAATSQLASAAAFVSDQAEAKGFVEDSTLNLLLRNYYYNRSGINVPHSNSSDPRDWVQSVQGVFSSGFTQGTVGFGVDAFGYANFALDHTSDHVGTSNLQTNGSNSIGKAGADVKIRFSKTQLTIGDMQPSTAPVFAVGGSKAIPQTATGLQLQSSEIKGLDLEAGHFTSATSNVSTTRGGELGGSYINTGITANSIDYAGGRYAATDALTFGLYASNLEDIWKQYYANVNYVLALPAEQSIAFDFNYYKTSDAGSAKAGDIDNNTFSLAAAYTFLSAHTLTLGFQKVNGGTPFDYIGVGGRKDGSGAAFGDSIFLANSVQWSDFNGPGERSWKAQYNLDMSTFGVPGLSFMTRYLYGDQIHAVSGSATGYTGYGYVDGASHQEIDAEAKYVVQGGPVKNLSVRLRQAWHRAYGGQPDGSVDEFRIIVDYPISIL